MAIETLHLGVDVAKAELVLCQGLYVWSWQVKKGLPGWRDQRRIWPQAQTVGELVPPLTFRRP
jgi:hypothetical protein